MEELSEKFMEIFSGLERAHGTYEITGTKNTSKGVKKEGRAKTLHEPVTLDLWKKHFTHKDYHSSIQKNKNYYSALQIYRDPNLTYRMVIQACMTIR